MPNAFAYLALLLAIPVGVGAFFTFRAPIAALIVFFGMVMFLPEKTVLDLPGLPGLGKQEAAALACLFGALLRSRRKLRDARIFRGPDRWAVLLMLAAFGTVLTNKEELHFGAVTLPALGMNEGMSVAFLDFVSVLLPFFLGRALFSTARDLENALAALVIAALVYSPLYFIELMLSPQLHNWIYGFHQHDFVQTLRGGGYRPMVFMAHGLAASMVVTFAVLAGITLHRARRRMLGMPPSLVTGYTAVFLFAVKSLGAALYAVAFAPVLGLLNSRALVRVAVLLSVIVFSYPLLRAVDAFPDRALVSLAYSASGNRAESLDYRFTMETMLSKRAGEKPWFGWGRFRRAMVFDGDGRVLSVSDGQWIVQYGVRGAVGFVGLFALLLSPIFLLRKRLTRVESRHERTLLAGLAVIVTVAAVDLLPNGLFNVLPVFLAGILYGTTRGISAQPATSSPEAVPVIRRVA